MAVRIGENIHQTKPKKTKQGNSINTKRSHKGCGPNGSTQGKFYKKRNRGQGKRQ